MCFGNVFIPEDTFVSRACEQGREKKAGKVSGGDKKRASKIQCFMDLPVSSFQLY